MDSFSHNFRQFFIFFVLLTGGLTACSSANRSVPSTTPFPPLIAQVSTPALTQTAIPTTTQTASPTSTATATPTPQPTATLLPSTTPTPSPALPPTATPALSHPMMIDALRHRTYQGGEMTYVWILGEGGNFARYTVSHLSEGYRVYGLLTMPHGDPPETGWPVIIFNHGYVAPNYHDHIYAYQQYVEAFASNGYIVFVPDYRGHGYSQGEAVPSYWSADYTIDVLNGIEALKQLPEVDADRIGMWGHSMGGHVTLRAMVVSDEIRAGVIWGGVAVSYPDMFNLWGSHYSGGMSTPTPDPTRIAYQWYSDLFAEQRFS